MGGEAGIDRGSRLLLLLRLLQIDDAKHTHTQTHTGSIVMHQDSVVPVSFIRHHRQTGIK